MQAVTMETDACTHEQTELRRWAHSNGSQHLKMQCLNCGAGVGNAIPKDKAPSNLAAADTTLRARYDAERTAAFESERRAKRQAWQSDYAAYLASPEWKAKRDKVLKRANYVCEGCGDAKATVVHHLTYKR